MPEGLTVECTVHFRNGRRGRKKLRAGEKPEAPDVPEGRVPRVSKLVALALRFERLIEDGHVKDYAQLARLGHVSRARITQIMNLRLLAPDIQEEILFLPRIRKSPAPVTERDLRPIAAEPNWHTQRKMWRDLTGGSNSPKQPS